jgi:hypothetical protein
LTDRLSDLSELAAVCICVWESKVRVIEEVEEPCAYGELAFSHFGIAKAFSTLKSVSK